MKARPCDRRDGASRLAQAQTYLEAAELYRGEPEPAAASISASNAVLAAIAASDAACCVALGRHAQGDDHRDAADLLATVRPGGDVAANALRRALSLKSKSQYGLETMSATSRDNAIRQAEKLIAFAQAALERG